MSKQLTLALRAPAEHADFVHTQKRHGTVLIWKQHASSRQWIKIQPNDDLALLMAEHLGQNDRYFTPNEFTQWRRVDLLRSLFCQFLQPGFSNRSWPRFWQQTEDKMAHLRITQKLRPQPRPSLARQ